MMTRPYENQSLAIVIPVRNAAHLLPECLGALIPQLRAGDSIVVVDDASDDDSAVVAEQSGANVIRRSEPGGPYAARNDGWRATSQPYVLFTDARCVARDVLLDRIRDATSRGPHLVFAEIVVRSGSRLAERVAAERQHLSLAYYRRTDPFLPFFPTACLAVKRESLQAVDGFRVVESGGDVDLCWRVQLAGFQETEELREPLVEWRPRTGVRSLVQQWAKYGRSNAWLRHEYRSRGAKPQSPVPTARLTAIHARRSLRSLRRRGVADAPEVFLEATIDLAFGISYGRATRSLRRTAQRSGA
jgi:glycosyltransferase involved in cell wall biosynthesis